MFKYKVERQLNEQLIVCKLRPDDHRLIRLYALEHNINMIEAYHVLTGIGLAHEYKVSLDKLESLREEKLAYLEHLKKIRIK